VTASCPHNNRMKWRSIQKNAEVGLASLAYPQLAIFQFRLKARRLIASCVACFMRTFKLLIFFNLVFIPVLVLSFFGAAYVVRGQLQESAEQQVLENSRIMMQTARASRLYTTKQISPLLDHEQSRVDKANNSVFQILDMQLPAALQKAIDSISRPKDKQVLESIRQQILDNVRQASRELPGPEFFPQSIPFYASTENFNYFRGQYPDYSYKEAALNATNPRDRTVDWEADVVNIFRHDPARTEVTGHRDTPDGAALYFCAPIRVDDASCLTCHSTPETAPVEMVKIYGTANGFGWKLNDVVGAQIVSIPAKLADASAERALRTILLWLGGILGFVLVAANIIRLLFFGRSHPNELQGHMTEARERRKALISRERNLKH
jgi:hypothetical protein